MVIGSSRISSSPQASLIRAFIKSFSTPSSSPSSSTASSIRAGGGCSRGALRKAIFYCLKEGTLEGVMCRSNPSIVPRALTSAI
jgi:hypothetical protein